MTEIDKLKKLLKKKEVEIKELKLEISNLMVKNNEITSTKDEMILLKKLNSEFKEMAQKAGSECAKYRHDLERLRK
jgi:hypothetical protein